MSNGLYNEVLRNIHNEEFYEKKDKQLLFQNMPYSLKNKLIMQMYKPIIKNFVFFKDIDNSDFIVKVATSLKPLISVKGDIVIQEGDYIKEIIFVKKGMLGLNISIDINNHENSIQKYYDLIEIEKFSTSNFKSSLLKQKSKSKKLLDYSSLFIKNEEDSNYIENDDNAEIEDINIIELRAKEHFGDALMFLNERCPLSVRIRTKTAELLILKKIEAIEIYSIYPNIWKRINKKSLYNMEQIYLKIRKTLIEVSNRYNKKKRKSTFFKKDKIIINKEKNNNNFLNKQRKQKKRNNKDDNVNNINKEKNNNNKEKENQLGKEINQNDIQNMTFYKINSIKKDSIRSEDSFKGEMANYSVDENGNKRNNKLTEVIKKNFNTSVLKPIKKYSKGVLKTDDFYKDKEINNDHYKNENENTDINHQEKYLIYNDNNYSEKSIKENNNSIYNSNKNNKSKNILNSSHKKRSNKYIYLSTTKENSIQINCSYENINKISHYKYINNINLQNKIKKFINE